MNFLSLGEQFYSTASPPYPELTALRILSSIPGNFHLSAAILPVPAWTLIPAHPLKSRGLALAAFHRSMVGWFSSQMENIPDNDLDRFLQAVGDPFQFPDLPLQDRRPVPTADYKPMGVAVILIEFASSDLWRNHLRRSNFASCEEILSTEEGRGDALKCMFHTATHSRLGLLRTPAKIIAAVRRLEELQCLNTAEVVILWAWTAGVADVAGYDAWGSIEHNTLNFYQTHGIRRLTILSRHITDTTMESSHKLFLCTHYQGFPCRVSGVQQPVPLEEAEKRWDRWLSEVRVAQACQLRRLYQLFGYDPMTWKEVVAVEEVDRNPGPLSGWSVTPTQFTDWACDYP